MARTEEQSKQKIKKLIKLNEELENYFRNTIIPQLFVDADLILRKFTPPAMKQFRFFPAHIGKPIEELVDNIRYSTLIENIREVIETEQILEKEIQTTDGHWFQMNIIPYLIKKGNRANGVIVTFIDITGRMENLRELEKLNAAHETFIYSVTHDLLAPLSNIEGLTNLLVEVSQEVEIGKEEQQKVAEMLDRSVKTMRTIINDLTEMTKANDKDDKPVPTISFEEILKEVELTIKDQVNRSGARLVLHIQEPQIGFSRKNLRSIIYNLLSNAIKYKSPDRAPEVHIETKKEEGFVVISVRDNGLGISKEKEQQIFHKFTRIDHEVEGVGIGLYLVKKIVENVGGKITVTSTLGKGSEFKVFLKPA